MRRIECVSHRQTIPGCNYHRERDRASTRSETCQEVVVVSLKSCIYEKNVMFCGLCGDKRCPNMVSTVMRACNPDLQRWAAPYSRHANTQTTSGAGETGDAFLLGSTTNLYEIESVARVDEANRCKAWQDIMERGSRGARKNIDSVGAKRFSCSMEGMAERCVSTVFPLLNMVGLEEGASRATQRELLDAAERNASPCRYHPRCPSQLTVPRLCPVASPHPAAYHTCILKGARSPLLSCC